MHNNDYNPFHVDLATENSRNRLSLEKGEHFQLEKSATDHSRDLWTQLNRSIDKSLTTILMQTSNLKRKTEFGYSCILSVIIIFFGCAGSQVPIAPPGDAPVDKQLLGDWIEIVNNEKDSIPDKMEVFQFNDYEYLLKYIAIDTTGSEMLLVRAFTTPVNDVLFANVQCLGCDDDNDYILFRYMLTDGGILKVRPVKTEFYGDPMFSASAELYDFIRNHLDDNEIYEPGTQFKKEKKY